MYLGLYGNSGRQKVRLAYNLQQGEL